jgi:ribonuclease J
MADKKLRIVPIGGLGEFGMNMMAIRYGDDIIVIDAGMMFPESELLGVDIVTPDLTYLKENRALVRALLITHGHEDHIGGVPFFLEEFDVPIYATPFTISLIERRLEEYDIDNANLKPVRPKDFIEIGPFKIEFIHVTHSIVSAVALAITTPLGVIIHTGDFKVDPTPTDNELFDLHTLADYGKRGVLLLLSDSTNADRPGYSDSERAVRPRLEDVFNRAENNRLFVSCFSSSIHRLQQILELSNEFGRKVALVGRSMISVTEIAHKHGLLDIPDNILMRPQDVMNAKPGKVTVLISGTQGEPMSALSRVAVDNHKHISVKPGDTVVLSSRIIPGNEKPIFRMIDHLSKRGADVMYGSMNPPLHVSGHGSMEELRLVLNLVRPRYFIPVHGEYRQLSKHVRLASHLRGIGLEETFILETGDVVEIDHRGARRAGRVTVGRVCIDSGAVGEVVGDMVIRDRRVISEDGIVIPIIAINKHSGRIESAPEIVSKGFALDSDVEFMRTAREAVSRTLEMSSDEEKMDVGVMKEKIRADLKRFISRETQRRPMIMPVIMEI